MVCMLCMFSKIWSEYRTCCFEMGSWRRAGAATARRARRAACTWCRTPCCWRARPRRRCAPRCSLTPTTRQSLLVLSFLFNYYLNVPRYIFCKAPNPKNAREVDEAWRNRVRLSRGPGYNKMDACNTHFHQTLTRIICDALLQTQHFLLKFSDYDISRRNGDFWI